MDGESPSAAQVLASDLDDDALFAISQGVVTGVVVVSYDTRSLRVLDGCRVDASYVTRSHALRETITKLSLTSTLVVRVRGQETATITRLGRSHLQGKDSSCAGATHFVSRMALGALSLTGDAPSIHRARRIGDLEACRTSDTDTGAPPRDCRAPLAFELVPISET